MTKKELLVELDQVRAERDNAISCLEKLIAEYEVLLPLVLKQNKVIDEQRPKSEAHLNISRSLVDLYFKRTKGPSIHRKKTLEFWEPYQIKYDDYISAGKSPAWALNKIGNLMETDNVWKKKSNKDPKKLVTRPNKATLRRRLITDRK